MPFELIREYIVIDQEISGFETQTSVEELIKIADYKANMRRILAVDGDTDAMQYRIENNLLVIEGNLIYKILYLTEDSSLDSAQATVPFNYTVELNNVAGDVEYYIQTVIEHIDYRITNSRKVNIRSILGLSGKIAKKNNYPLLSGIKDLKDIQTLKNSTIITRKFRKENDQHLIKEKIKIGEDKESQLELIDTQFKLMDIKVNKSPSGILLNGKIHTKALYVSEIQENKTYKTLEHLISYSQFIEKAGVEKIDECRVKSRVNNINSDFATDSETGEIYLDVELLLNSNTIFYENIKIENIQDLYSPSISTEIQKENISTYQLTNLLNKEISINEKIDVQDNKQIEKLLYVDGKIQITNIEKLKDKVKIEEILKINIVYKSKDQEKVIDNIEKEYSLAQEFNINNINDDEIKIDVIIDLENIDCSNNGKQLIVDGTACISGEILKDVKLNIIDTVEEIQVEEEKEKDEKYYTIKIYYKQPGEDLWEIAKENRTTINKIIKDNDIKDADKIADYTPLIIS